MPPETWTNIKEMPNLSFNNKYKTFTVITQLVKYVDDTLKYIETNKNVNDFIGQPNVEFALQILNPLFDIMNEFDLSILPESVKPYFTMVTDKSGVKVLKENQPVVNFFIQIELGDVHISFESLLNYLKA